MNNRPTLSICSETGAVYIYLQPDKVANENIVAKTTEFSGQVLLDFNKDGELIGIELISGF